MATGEQSNWLRTVIFIALVLGGLKLTATMIEKAKLKRDTEVIFGTPTPVRRPTQVPSPDPCANRDTSQPNYGDLPCNPTYKEPYDPNATPTPKRRRALPAGDLRGYQLYMYRLENGGRRHVGELHLDDLAPGRQYGQVRVLNRSSAFPQRLFQGTYDGTHLKCETSGDTAAHGLALVGYVSDDRTILKFDIHAWDRLYRRWALEGEYEATLDDVYAGGGPAYAAVDGHRDGKYDTEQYLIRNAGNNSYFLCRWQPVNGYAVSEGQVVNSPAVAVGGPYWTRRQICNDARARSFFQPGGVHPFFFANCERHLGNVNCDEVWK
jgi:hypothetical protein